MAQSTLTQFQILPRPRWRGFSFALHRHGAGLFFLPGGVSASHNRLRLSFCRQCNYTTTTPKPFTGLYRGFSVDLPHSSAHNTAGAQAAYTPPAPRWRAYRQALHFHRYQTPPPNRDTVQGRAAAYYNKVYIRVRSCYGFMPDSAAYHRPCQPGGVSVSCLHPVQKSAQRLEVWHRVSSQGAPGLLGTLHPAGQSINMGAAGGAEPLAACRRISFRAFAR